MDSLQMKWLTGFGMLPYVIYRLALGAILFSWCCGDAPALGSALKNKEGRFAAALRETGFLNPERYALLSASP
jgi:hypothetical protein